MEKTNRNWKLPLNRAWQHYWRDIFPDSDGWEVDIKRQLLAGLYFPERKQELCAPRYDFPDDRPSWAKQLDVEMGEALVTFRYAGRVLRDFKYLLSVSGFILTRSNWCLEQFIDDYGNLKELTYRDESRICELLGSEVYKCWSVIHGKLLTIIQMTDRPTFDVFAIQAGDLDASERLLPAATRAQISCLNISGNTLSFTNGGPKFVSVRLKKRQPSGAKAGRHGSFKESDAELVKVMKEGLDRGEFQSVAAAADSMIKKAGRRSGASDDSVKRRLQDVFSKMHPGYSASKSGKRQE